MERSVVNKERTLNRETAGCEPSFIQMAANPSGALNYLNFVRREGVNVKKNKPSLLRTAAGGDFLFCSNPRDN
jgi:hypothetical protein